MSKLGATIYPKEKQARRVCLVIGIFGLLILWFFNWNCQLIFSGYKYQSEVIRIHENAEKCYLIDIEFRRMNGELVQKQLSDCTGESFLFWIHEGDRLHLWESKDKPFRTYVPFLHFSLKLFLAFFFIFVPFLFFFIGKV